jgi:hypothetical protein
VVGRDTSDENIERLQELYDEVEDWTKGLYSLVHSSIKKIASFLDASTPLKHSRGYHYN